MNDNVAEDEVEDIDVAEDEVEDDDADDDDAKGEDDDVHIEEEEDDDVERGWCWGGKPIPRPGPICGSLRSQNACQHFTRATLYGNLQVKCARPEWAPWSSAGLCSYRKNPSVDALFGEKWA